MDIVSNDEFEFLKQQSSIWQNYNGSISIDDREIIRLKYNNDVVLPKFFIERHQDILCLTTIGKTILDRTKEWNKPYENIQPHKMDMICTAVPREEQIEVFDIFEEHMKKYNRFNGIIVAKPGVGKTMISIKLASMFGTKSICIVPNDLLETQWVESIVKFTNLEVDDIGIVQGSDINKLKKQGVYDKAIVVCKIQSLLSQLKTMDLFDMQNLYSQFGAVFYDECHTSGSAESYSKTACIFLTNNIIGLSATPFTKGINNFLMYNSMGEIVVQLEHQNLIPTIHIHRVHVPMDDQEIRKLRWAKDDYIKFLAMHNSILESKYEYLEYIVDLNIYRMQTGHKTAILFSTNKLVHTTEKILRAKGYDPGIIIGKTKKKADKALMYITTDDYNIYYNNYSKVFPKRKTIKEYKTKYDPKIGYYINVGKALEKDIIEINKTGTNINIIQTIQSELSEREIMNLKDCIVSNFKLLTAGYSKEELSCIFIGNPLIGKISTIQVTGRITRSCEEKPQDTYAHFFMSDIFLTTFPSMASILMNNLKVAYPTARFVFEGFEKKETE